MERFKKIDQEKPNTNPSDHLISYFQNNIDTKMFGACPECGCAYNECECD